MNKHLLSTIAAAMLPIGMSSASLQSTSVYSYVGSRNNKNTTYAASSNASNVANKYAQQRTNENPLALKVNESADKLTAASLQQTLMAESELTLSTANNRANSNRAANNLTLNDQTSTSLQNAQIMTVSGDLQSLQTVVQSNVTELIIIDAAVPDKHAFYQQLKPGVEVKEINSEQDGLLQLNEILSNYQNLSALHLVSHGDDGVIYLGNTQVNEQLLKEKVETFSALNNALKEDADLLLYGCNVAKTDKGESLLKLIANESHIDVAASNNLTGNIANNADWNLEIAQGNINSKQLFNSNSMRDFSDILAVNDGAGTTITTGGFLQHTFTPAVSYEPTPGFNLTLATFNNSSAVNGIYCGFGYCAVDFLNSIPTDELRIYFSGGQTFNLSSINLLSLAGNNTYVLTPSVGLAINTSSLNTSLGSDVPLNFTDVTSVSITRLDGGPLIGFNIDNLAINGAESENFDGNLTASSTLIEPINIPSTATESTAADVFDFTITDGGASDGLPLDITQVKIDVSGSATDTLRGDTTWRLSGPDVVPDEVGVYDASTDTLTFSGLNISVADATSEIYTVNAFMNTANAVTDNATFILTIDGDTDLTVASSGTQMGTTTSVTNGTGGKFEVNATNLEYTTAPAGSVSGMVLNTQPVVVAVDAFDNIDTDFTETITLTEASAGSLTGASATAAGGVATFAGVNYSATADQQSFTLTANDVDGTGSDLATTSASSITSDVVATQLVFATQPVPLSLSNGELTSFTTVPVIEARNAQDIVDTGYSSTVTLAEVNGAGSITLSGTGDTDASGATVSLSPSSGVVTFSGLKGTYTLAGTTSENFNLQANSGSLTSVISSQLTGLADLTSPTVTSVSVPTNGTYVAGDILSFTVNYDENVTVNTSGGIPQLAITVGSTTRQATYVNGSGTSALLFRYTVQSGDNDTDGITIGTLAVNGGTLKDAAGNNALITLSSTGSTTSVLIDAAVPSVSSVSVPANGTYGAGDNLDFTVNYDENVTVSTAGGIPHLAITVGSTTRQATYVNGSGTSALLFRYIIQAGESDSDGIVIGSLSANGGTLKDASSNSASLALNSVALTTAILVDTSGPTIGGTPATTVAQGGVYTFTPTVTDVDANDTTTFSINTTPSWATFDTMTGTLTGTPTNDDIGTTSNIIITVTDGGMLTDSLTAFSLEVTNVNDAPVISGAPATSVDAGSDYSFIPVVTDIDDEDTQTFTVVNKPDWATFNEATGELSGTPSDIHIGITSDIVITVADAAGEKASLAAFSIEVVEVEASIKAVDDVYEFSRSADNTYTLNVLDNDIAQADSEITITASSTSIGDVAIESNQLVLTVDADFVGAVDVSYSISNNKEEFSQANVSVVITGDTDSLNVIVAPGDIEVNATGLYTPVNLGVATATNESGNSIAVNLVGNTLFTPGNHIAYWETAVEGNESTSTVSQQVVVHPLVSLSKDQVVLEGTTASVRVLLNGEAPVYPLTIPFEISGSVDTDDYIIDVDSIDVESGTEAVITISTVDDGVPESDETLTITLGDVNKGNQFVHTMTITEGNIAPSIELSLSQDNELRQIITPTGGLVTVSASVEDINGDSITTFADYDSNLVIVEASDQLVFDPSTLAVGTYSVSVSATDDNVNPLSSTKSIYFSVKETLAVLSVADTDGDLIPDNQEGYSDSDSDGIPDYLDAISECNVIPQQVGNQDAYLVEGDAGICLRLGNTLADGETGGVQLTESELAAFTGESDTTTNVGGIFDYIATGLPVNGQDYHIVLPQRQPIPSNALYRKYNAAAGWTSFVEDADNQLHSASGQAGYCPPPSSDLWTDGLSEGHWCVQLTIVDGGPNDDDGEANGTIVDPGGVAVAASDNTAPVAVNDSVNVKAGESVIIDVLANDTDVDSDTLTLGVVTANLGTVTITSDNQIEYQTPTDFIGADVVTYTVSDGQGGTASATVNVDVFINQAPVAVADSASTDDRTAITIDVLTNDTDSDNDVLSVLSATVDVGSVVVNSDGSLTYLPELGFDGVATISYALTDGVNDSVLGMVNVEVTALETVTVENKSKGGNMGIMVLLMTVLAAFRAKSRLNVKARSASMLAALVGLCSFNTSASESEGWFVSGAIGQSTVIERIDTSNVSDVKGVSFDDSDTSFHFGVGYQFTDYSITLGYELLGDTSASITGDTLDATQYQASLLEAAPMLVNGLSFGGQYHVWRNEMFTVSAGLGLLIWDLDYESRVQDNVVVVDDSGVDVFYKLQVAYKINDKVAVNLQATRYDLPLNDVNNIAVGVTYQF